MSDMVKVALIVAAVAVIGIGASIYFSPYQTCIRSMMEMSDGGMMGASATGANRDIIKLLAEQRCAAG
jgi:disulfide bond formation protein DsbB